MKSRKWARGVKDNVPNRDAWRALVLKAMREPDGAFLAKLQKGMRKRLTACLRANGGPVRW